MKDKEELLRDHQQRMAEIELRNLETEYRNKERDAKLNKPKKWSASKIVIAAMILLCLQIIIYAEWVMYALQDITALYVLIGVPATLTVSIWGYYSKSKAENVQGGLVYDATMLELKSEYNEDEPDEDGSVG